MIMNDSLYGNFRTRKFTDIWNNASDFVNDYKTCGLPVMLNDEDVNVLFILLYANYGNSHIASSDENQFQYKLFSIIYTDGVVWNKKRKMLEKMLDLSDNEILESSTQIHNHAYNPGQGGTTTVAQDELIGFVDDQTASKTKRAKMDAFSMYSQLLEDSTNEFIKKFKNLFLKIVNPEVPLWYVTEEEE